MRCRHLHSGCSNWKLRSDSDRGRIVKAARLRKVQREYGDTAVASPDLLSPDHITGQRQRRRDSTTREQGRSDCQGVRKCGDGHRGTSSRSLKKLRRERREEHFRIPRTENHEYSSCEGFNRQRPILTRLRSSSPAEGETHNIPRDHQLAEDEVIASEISISPALSQANLFIA